MKKATIGAALAGLLFLGAAAWTQDPEPVERQVAPPSFRDVLRGKVGQKVYYQYDNDSSARRLYFGHERKTHTFVAVGEDFIQLREDDGMETFISVSRVDVHIIPAK